jgi:hypothetical protein
VPPGNDGTGGQRVTDEDERVHLRADAQELTGQVHHPVEEQRGEDAAVGTEPVQVPPAQPDLLGRR